MEIQESPARSLHVGPLPVGCQQCIKGQKAVIFAGGSCTQPRDCHWYCPISKERKDPTSFFINERLIHEDTDLIREIEAIDAKGISFTGGDPLGYAFPQVIHWLKFLKQERGMRLHAHLYTNGINATLGKMEQLANAGLNEIRFHPPMHGLSRVKFAINRIPDVGMEIPAIPTRKYIKYMKKVVRFLEKIGANFLNLNEFEFSVTNATALKERGFQLKQGTMAAVDGSETAALEILEWHNARQNEHVSIHYCPIITKDEYQLRNRYLRRAANTRLPHESPTPEGTLLFGKHVSVTGHEMMELRQLLQRLSMDYPRTSVHHEGHGQDLIHQQDELVVVFHKEFLQEKRLKLFAMKHGHGKRTGLVEAIPVEPRQECEFTPITLL
ncbi:radical SAM protein [Candidatus Bathyarchaeota archaeon]|nr:radical SAM protein [Candidatus Bathyarchaeota archaeon]